MDAFVIVLIFIIILVIITISIIIVVSFTTGPRENTNMATQSTAKSLDKKESIPIRAPPEEGQDKSLSPKARPTRRAPKPIPERATRKPGTGILDVPQAPREVIPATKPPVNYTYVPQVLPIISQNIIKPVIKSVPDPIVYLTDSISSNLYSASDTEEDSYSRSYDEDLSTPYEKEDGVIYCRPETLNNRGVIDVSSYSNFTLFLLKDGTITLEGGSKKKSISSNIRLIRICNFLGDLYSLSSDHTLYHITNIDTEKSDWIWEPVKWAPGGITHISVTHAGDYLWLQTHDKGYGYSSTDYAELELTDFKDKRVYGATKGDYIDINTKDKTAMLNSNSGTNLIHNVKDAAINYHGEVVLISEGEESKYNGIVMLNWIPYYLSI